MKRGRGPLGREHYRWEFQMDVFRAIENVATWTESEVGLPLPFSLLYLGIIGNALEFRGHKVICSGLTGEPKKRGRTRLGWEYPVASSLQFVLRAPQSSF